MQPIIQGKNHHRRWNNCGHNLKEKRRGTKIDEGKWITTKTITYMKNNRGAF